jgi:hypothetical protein
VLGSRRQQLDGGGADYTATFTHGGGPAISIADTDTLITDADGTTIASATITIGINRQSDDVLTIAGPAAGRHYGVDL